MKKTLMKIFVVAFVIILPHLVVTDVMGAVTSACVPYNATCWKCFDGGVRYEGTGCPSSSSPSCNTDNCATLCGTPYGILKSNTASGQVLGSVVSYTSCECMGSATIQCKVYCAQGSYGNPSIAFPTEGCTQCPTGYTTAGAGATSKSDCNSCAKDYYGNGTTCTKCPTNSTTDIVGATSISACKCNASYYMLNSTYGYQCSSCSSDKYGNRGKSSRGSTSISDCTIGTDVEFETSIGKGHYATDCKGQNN